MFDILVKIKNDICLLFLQQQMVTKKIQQARLRLANSQQQKRNDARKNIFNEKRKLNEGVKVKYSSNI